MVGAGLVVTRAHRRRRIGVSAGLVAVLIAAAMAVGAPSASAAPFSCDAFGYLFQAPTGSPPGVIQQIDLATGAATNLGSTTPNDVLNAVGYNQQDNLFYAWDLTTSHMVQVNNDLTLTQVPSGTFPGGVVGDFDPAGHYWAFSGTTIYELDYVPGSPTFGQVLTTIPIGALPAGITNGGADWAWINGFLYMIGADAGGAGHLLRIDPTTGARTDLTPAGFGSGIAGIGAVYADPSGNLYGSDNASGAIWRVNTTTHAAIKVSTGPTASSNDGARCASAPIPTITVTKAVDGRVRPADQFTVGLVKPDGSAATSATTAGTATTVSTVDFPASQGKTYTITDAMSGGSPTPLGEYVKSIACVDGNGNAVATGGSGPSWTLNVANATAYTCTITNKAQADLEIVKTASPTPAVPGTDETYSLKVTNHGPSTASSVSVSDPLPSGLSFVSADTGCTNASGTVTCTVASLAPGASTTFTVKAHLASSVDSCADIRNTATVTSSIADPDPSNNSSTFCPQFKGKSDLSLTKSPSRTQVPQGGQEMYTLVVKNNGPSDDTGVLVTDPMATGLTLVAATPSQGSCSTAGGKVSCNIGTLKAGGSAQVLVTATVTAASGGNVANTASATGDKEDPNPSNNDGGTTIAVVPGPEPHFDLVMDKTANHRSITAGQSVTYELAVTNKGPDAAPNAKVTDTISTSMTIVSLKTTQGSCTKGSPITCSLGTIPAGGKVTITVVAKPKATGSRQRNAASATGDGTDGDPSNNLDKVDLAVKIKLRIAKVADRTTVTAGGRIHYTIRVTNPSRYSVDDVRVCDTLPSGLVYVSSSPKATLSHGRQCWSISHLAGHRSKSYKLTVRALNGASGSKTNRVSATGPGVSTARARRTVHVLGTATGAPPVTG